MRSEEARAGSERPETGALDRAPAATPSRAFSQHMLLSTSLRPVAAASLLVSTHCLVLNAPSAVTRGHPFIAAVRLSCIEFFYGNAWTLHGYFHSYNIISFIKNLDDFSRKQFLLFAKGFMFLSPSPVCMNCHLPHFCC